MRFDRRLRIMVVVPTLFFAVYLFMLYRMQAYLDVEDTTSATTTKTASKLDAVRISIPKYLPIHRDETGNEVARSLARPTGNYVIDSSDIWEQSNRNALPSWMKDYFRWHKESRSTLSLANWDEHRFIILLCHEKSAKCGGTADRLSPMPFLLKLAAKSQRLFFLYWGRPCELEQFLLPPVGGMDWRLPRLLKAKLFSRANFGTTEEDLLRLADSKAAVVTCRFQSHDHGAMYYDKMRRTDESSFSMVTRDTWNVLFTPSPAVSALVLELLTKSHLNPGNYVGVHLRALYSAFDRDPAFVRYWTENAVNCSSQLAPRLPIFFAADNLAASILAQRYGDKTGISVATRRQYKTEPLHLDKATNWRNRDPSEYYDAFVDLYLLSLARCVAYGMGGFGKLASLLSYNASCAMQHHSAFGITPCKLVIMLPCTDEPGKRTSLFLLPMPPKDTLLAMGRSLDS